MADRLTEEQLDTLHRMVTTTPVLSVCHINTVELRSLIEEVKQRRVTERPREGDMDVDKTGNAYRVWDGLHGWSMWKSLRDGVVLDTQDHQPAKLTTMMNHAKDATAPPDATTYDAQGNLPTSEPDVIRDDVDHRMGNGEGD